jgi:hypothetical protein
MKSLQTDLAALKSAKKRVKIILENSNELR